MLREVKKGKRAFLGAGKNARRLVAGERFNDKDYPEMSKKKLDSFSDEVKGKKSKPEDKGKGHLGQEPVDLSKMTRDDAKKTGPV